MNTRLQQLTDWLNTNQHDFTFINSPANVFYLSHFQCHPHERLLGLVVFPEKEPFLVCPQMETSRAHDAGWSGEIVDYGDADDPWKKIQQAIHKRGENEPHSIAIEKGELPYERAEILQQLFPDVSFSNAEEKLQQLRMIKDEHELKILREAALLADFGVEAGVAAISRGKTEMEVLAEVEYELKKKGISEMAFSTMVLAGTNAANPHGTPGSRKIDQGDFVLFDLGVVLHGYCSDITRTVAFQDASDEQRKIYDVVLQAQKATLANSKPGMRIGDLDQTAHDVIAEAGYSEYFPHRIGHGLGIEAHEYPSLSNNNDNILEPGMVFTAEPGIYVSDIAGVRIEDDVVVTEEGYECLTHYPKELQIVK